MLYSLRILRADLLVSHAVYYKIFPLLPFFWTLDVWISMVVYFPFMWKYHVQGDVFCLFYTTPTGFTFEKSILYSIRGPFSTTVIGKHKPLPEKNTETSQGQLYQPLFSIQHTNIDTEDTEGKHKRILYPYLFWFIDRHQRLS